MSHIFMHKESTKLLILTTKQGEVYAPKEKTKQTKTNKEE